VLQFQRGEFVFLKGAFLQFLNCTLIFDSYFAAIQNGEFNGQVQHS
jgi:hypothetical protein